MRTRVTTAAGLVLGFLMVSAGGVARAEDPERLLLRVGKPYDAVVAAVGAFGGQVHFKYDNVDAIAVSVPKDKVAALTALVGPSALTKDPMVALPAVPAKAMEEGELAAQVLEGDALAAALKAAPDDYNFNNDAINASVVHRAGKTGQGVIVAVLDSGTANSKNVPALFGRVIGGESFVPGASEPGATSRLNAPHGTWVGSVIAANIAFGFAPTSLTLKAIKQDAPDAVLSPCPDPARSNLCFVPMVGVAPDASLYALKVFPASGGGAPESRVIAAMDRAITLRRNFNDGVSNQPFSGSGAEADPFTYKALKIDVVNMSLGGGTLNAGRDLEDLLTLEMLKVGITIVASAGNEGPAAMTGGSPGTGRGTLTVGASSDVRHQRIVDDRFSCPGYGLPALTCGALLRPTTHTQIAYFSSRGPTADGRLDPELVANGDWTFAQGTCQGGAACVAGTGIAGISWVSGTSFSAPTVSGAAALLRSPGAPAATATQVRNALVKGANRGALGDGSGAIDQGAGLLDVQAALAKLPGASKELTDSEPCQDDEDGPGRSVENNVRRAGLDVVSFEKNQYHVRVKNLLPGQVKHLFIPIDEKTDQLTVTLTNLTPALPPAQQNQIFGDDLYVQIVDAPTSTADVLAEGYVFSDVSIPFDHPQTGLVRVAIQGDLTNAGRISADVTIARRQGKLTSSTAKGRITEGELAFIDVEVPAGAAQAAFELSWDGNWGRYPTNDIDMYVFDPAGNLSTDGATLSSPERVVFNAPTPGVWTVAVQGFTINARVGGHDHDQDVPTDKYTLRATADGKALKQAK